MNVPVRAIKEERADEFLLLAASKPKELAADGIIRSSEQKEEFESTTNKQAQGNFAKVLFVLTNAVLIVLVAIATAIAGKSTANAAAICSAGLVLAILYDEKIATAAKDCILPKISTYAYIYAVAWLANYFCVAIGFYDRTACGIALTIYGIYSQGRAIIKKAMH